MSLTKEEVRQTAIEAVHRELETLEVETSPEDVLKHSKPLFDAHKADVQRQFESHIANVGIAHKNFTEEVNKRLESGFVEQNRITGDLFEKVSRLLGEAKSKGPEALEAAKSAVRAVITPPSPYQAFLSRYGGPGRALKPILILGGQGSGKTTGAMQFAYGAGFSSVVFMEGHRGVEANDMIGGLRPHEGGVVWHDGKVGRAFRLAARGESVCLIIDEFYRIRQGDRSPLITALSPFVYEDGISKYKLSTGRVMSVADGIVEGEEVLMAPCHNLTVIATTNIGAGFDVDASDPAEMGRWLHYDVESTAENAKAVFEAVIARKVGWDDAAKRAIVAGMLQLLEGSKKLSSDNFLKLPLDVRVISDAIRLSEKPSELGRTLMETGMLCVGHTIEGVREKAQLDVLRKLIADKFTIAS